MGTRRGAVRKEGERVELKAMQQEQLWGREGRACVRPGYCKPAHIRAILG